MGSRVIHAPGPTTEPPFIGFHALCGAVSGVPVAAVGNKVTCRTCLKTLHGVAQFCNLLHLRGIDVSGLPERPRKRRRRRGEPKENA